MYAKNYDLEKINKSESEGDSVWTPTPLNDFSTRYAMTEYNLCYDSKCVCLCHQKGKLGNA